MIEINKAYPGVFLSYNKMYIPRFDPEEYRRSQGYGYDESETVELPSGHRGRWQCRGGAFTLQGGTVHAGRVSSKLHPIVWSSAPAGQQIPKGDLLVRRKKTASRRWWERKFDNKFSFLISWVDIVKAFFHIYGVKIMVFFFLTL